MENVKIPYGIADFKKIRSENYIYVDKTMFIEKLENNPFTLYVRPRRFGKSLFTSMISYYYDINAKDEFEELFKGLYIYDNPTQKKNSYYILSFNFSGMNVTDGKTLSDICAAFNDRVKMYCEDFIKKYNLPIELEKEKKEASQVLFELLIKFRRLNKENKIYVIIDEYDHFTNGILKGNVSAFMESLGQGGFVRAFYEVIKEYAEGQNGVVDRFFATGVAPLTLDSLTSGFNIATNLSTHPNFVSMCGLTEIEVKNLVKKVGLKEEVYNELKMYYDGYRFSEENDVHIFNVTLVMYYLKNYIEIGVAPRFLVDPNLAASGDKIESMVNLVNPKENYEKVMELITTGEVRGTLVRNFDMNDNKFDYNSFLSLLFYQGYITIKEVGIRNIYTIPNYVSQSLYASYLKDMIQKKKEYKIDTRDIDDGIMEFGENGSIEKITKVISSFLTYQSTRDKENFNEKDLKYAYSLIFSLSNQYNVYGEFPAMQGFADILIEKNNTSISKYEAIIELKYLNKQNARKTSMKKLVEEGKEQLKKYMEDKRLNSRENMKKYVIVFEGFEKYEICEIE